MGDRAAWAIGVVCGVLALGVTVGARVEGWSGSAPVATAYGLALLGGAALVLAGWRRRRRRFLDVRFGRAFPWWWWAGYGVVVLAFSGAQSLLTSDSWWSLLSAAVGAAFMGWSLWILATTPRRPGLRPLVVRDPPS